MSKAYKCDRCGRLFEYLGIHGISVEGSVTYHFKDYWYPKRLEFCSDCGKSLKLVVQEWFKKHG